MPVQPSNQDDRTGNKRRRINSVAAAHLYPTAPSSYQHQLPYSSPQHHVPVSPYADGVTGHYVVGQSQNSTLTTPSPGTLNTQHGQWAHSFSHTLQGYALTHQESQSMQHAYYYGQTDPSVYNSPWPPAQQDPQSSVHPQSILPTSQAQAMTYMQPTHYSPVDILQSYDTGSVSSYATTLHNFDVGSFGLRHDVHLHQPHQQHQVGKSPSNMYYQDASMHLKMQSLPILDSLATQLISTIAKYSFPQIQDLMKNSNDEDSQAYTILKNLFYQTRKVYSRDRAFIDAIAIHMFRPTQQEIIRKANIATFITSILGAHDISLFHLNKYYLETFVPLGNRLLKWQGAVFLELKTQAYISALMNSDTTPDRMLVDLFPHDLDAQILTRHPDAPNLSPSERDFIDCCRSRRIYLHVDSTSHDALGQLPKRYKWADFVRQFASSVNKNVNSIISSPNRAHQQLMASAIPPSDCKYQPTQDTLTILSSQPPNQTTPPASAISVSQGSLSAPKMGGAQTATSSSSASSTRQPWNKLEEDALIAGLARVSGQHWSQILALYGRGGSVSEVLKDRNQVQLKDKARNLKLWYLKTGREVPECLRGVTGELRKRGGVRARSALAAEEETASS